MLKNDSANLRHTIKRMRSSAGKSRSEEEKEGNSFDIVPAEEGAQRGAQTAAEEEKGCANCLCDICMSKPKNVMIEKCRHVPCCKECLDGLFGRERTRGARGNTEVKCPKCAGPIGKYKVVFL